MCWREQGQQMDAKQLSGRKQRGPSGSGCLREERVDEIVWKVRREHLQQRRGARGRKSLHAQTATLKNHLRLSETNTSIFSGKHLHTKPLAPNFVTPSEGLIWLESLVFCLETPIKPPRQQKS